MGVRGEQELPGDVARLLAATPESRRGAAHQVSYVAISVTRSSDGRVWVRRTTVDPHTKQVIPILLDEYAVPSSQERLTDHELLRYWASELCMRDYDQDFG